MQMIYVDWVSGMERNCNEMSIGFYENCIKVQTKHKQVASVEQLAIFQYAYKLCAVERG